jgi:hypothetical protein
MSCCVVSAYYQVPSKNPSTAYLQWMEPFFRNSTFPLVLFTEPQYIALFSEWREHCKEKTIFICLPFQELTSIKRWGAHMWMEQKQKDTEENHTPQLYCLWYEKKEFVRRAIEMEAFGAEKFVWCDAGILRYPEWHPFIHLFPQAERIESGKMTLLQIADFMESDTEETDFGMRNHVGGGIQAADRETWLWWCDEYDAMMNTYIASNRFVGKDQHLMASCYLRWKERVVLVRPPSGFHPIAMWFWLLPWLAGVA